MYMFTAHKNGVHQSGCLHNNYTAVTWEQTYLNEGNYFDVTTGLWTPPRGHIILSSSIWFRENFQPPPLTGGSPPANAVVKVFKNGVQAPAGAASVGWAPAATPYTAGTSHPGFMDFASGDDVYQVKVHGSSRNNSDDLVIDGHPNHTWLSGIAFADG